jgi:hypothetical protein
VASLSGKFSQIGLNQGDALASLLFNTALEYAIKKGLGNHVGLGNNTEPIKKTSQVLLSRHRNVITQRKQDIL